jgi:Flp pilus assembly protein TadD
MLRLPIQFSFAHATYLLFCTMFLLTFATAARSQTGGIDFDPGDPGTGGRNAIQGSVYYPSGRRLDKRIRVRLDTFREGELTTLTDDNGSFAFRRLAPGTYTVIIDGDRDYQASVERIDITQPISRRSGSGQVVTMQIQLKLKEISGVKPSVLNAVLAEVPAPALELYQRALESAQAGEPRRAIEQLQKAISLYPRFMLAFNELGVQFLKLGQLEKAADALQAALKVAPEAFLPVLNYGVVLVYMKQFEKAELALRSALEKDETSVVAHLYLGRALTMLNKYEEAERELKRALSLGAAEATEAHRYLGAIYNQLGEADRAITELETYLQLVPTAKDGDQIRQIIKQLKSESPSSKPEKPKGL